MVDSGIQASNGNCIDIAIQTDTMPKYNIIDVNTSAGIDSKNKKKLIKIYKKWKNI